MLQHLLRAGRAYYCYCTREELEALREKQRSRKEKPRYDGRHRDYQGPPRQGVEPVVRFKNPVDGDVEMCIRDRSTIICPSKPSTWSAALMRPWKRPPSCKGPTAPTVGPFPMPTDQETHAWP